MSRKVVFDTLVIPVDKYVTKRLALSDVYLETSDGRWFALDEVLNVLADKLLKAATIEEKKDGDRPN